MRIRLLSTEYFKINLLSQLRQMIKHIHAQIFSYEVSTLRFPNKRGASNKQGVGKFPKMK